MRVIPNLRAEIQSSTSKQESWKVYEPFTSTLKPKQSFKSPTAPVEVQELVQELAKVNGVAKVRAVVPRAEDIHWIEFELELHPETELDDETWDKIQDLVIDCEWGLRDKTNEKWYFDEKVVEKFFRIPNGAKVVALSGISLSSSKSYYNQVKSRWSEFNEITEQTRK
ncbi:MAG: hypothetical protein HC789_04350 [Microcoleus sp. CSU_2_2]|nr:hypothetical protein [Microcoleus sp. SU_5_3]NJS09658.1 hypothetical protein [Microcoleus sp. CSU_2_2]